MYKPPLKKKNTPMISTASTTLKNESSGGEELIGVAFQAIKVRKSLGKKRRHLRSGSKQFVEERRVPLITLKTKEVPPVEVPIPAKEEDVVVVVTESQDVVKPISNERTLTSSLLGKPKASFSQTLKGAVRFQSQSPMKQLKQALTPMKQLQVMSPKAASTI